MNVSGMDDYQRAGMYRRRAQKWRRVAERLADRLQHQAFCEVHPVEKADPDNCPSCDDRAAYLNYLAEARKKEHP